MNVISDGADSQLMLKGYDPVAYFTDGGPVVGRPDIKADYQGVTYRFASEDHRRLFTSRAAKYVPRFGGFCAMAMVYAIPRASDPEVFKIIENRLYVFGNPRQKLYFEMDQERNLKLAEQLWEKEARDSDRHWQMIKRGWLIKMPHYRSDEELAEEYESRNSKRLK